MKKILNECPICGGELEYGSYWQYTKYYKIGKKGKISKKCERKSDNGPMEANFIECVNGDFVTNCDMEVVIPEHSGIEISNHKEVYYFEM